LAAVPFLFGPVHLAYPDVTVDGGRRRLMLASLRYLDTLIKIEGT
jgi:hypothetical protein